MPTHSTITTNVGSLAPLTGNGGRTSTKKSSATSSFSHPSRTAQSTGRATTTGRAAAVSTPICNNYKTIAIISSANLTADNWGCPNSCVFNNSCFYVNGVEPRVLKKQLGINQTIAIIGSDILDTNSTLKMHSSVWINGELLNDENLDYVSSSLVLVTLDTSGQRAFMSNSNGSLEIMIRINGTSFNRSVGMDYFDPIHSYIQSIQPNLIDTNTSNSTLNFTGKFVDFGSNPACIVWADNENGTASVLATLNASFVSSTLMVCPDVNVGRGGVYNVDLLYSRPVYSTPKYPSIDNFYRPELFVQGYNDIILNVLAPAPSCSSRYSDTGTR